MLKDVKNGGEFYYDDNTLTKAYLIQYDFIDVKVNACFCTNRQDTVFLIKPETIVKIDVPSVKVKDVELGKNFRYYGEIYTKISFGGDRHSCIHDFFQYGLQDFKVTKLKSDVEVELVE